MDELKPCPFCGDDAELRGGKGVASWIICNNKECRATQGLELSGENAVKMWNTRPAEDALKAENEELRYIVERFGMWYNEDGCPKAQDPDFPCSAEYEYKNDPETEGDFDERDCWKEAHEHGCWVEYYRWKYRQKLNATDINAPTKESEGDDE